MAHNWTPIIIQIIFRILLCKIMFWKTQKFDNIVVKRDIQMYF